MANTKSGVALSASCLTALSECDEILQAIQAYLYWKQSRTGGGQGLEGARGQELEEAKDWRGPRTGGGQGLEGAKDWRGPKTVNEAKV